MGTADVAALLTGSAGRPDRRAGRGIAGQAAAGPAARSQAPALHADHVVLGDGTRLPLARWQPEAAPEAVVIGLHGYGDYRAVVRPAWALAGRARIALLAYDQRGFGETGSRGRWPGASTLIQDLADVVEALRADEPGVPLVVLGESMGGSVALAGLGSGKVRGVDRLILAAPACAAARCPCSSCTISRYARRAGPALARGRAAPRRPPVARPGGGRAARRRPADPARAQRRHLRGPDRARQPGLATSPRRRCRRRSCSMASSTARSRAPRSTSWPSGSDERGTLRLYPERHHLLLHEQGAEQVFADCLNWLLPRARSRPRKGTAAAPWRSVQVGPDLALGRVEQRGQHDQEQHHLEAGLLARLEGRLGRPRSGTWRRRSPSARGSPRCRRRRSPGRRRAAAASRSTGRGSRGCSSCPPAGGARRRLLVAQEQAVDVVGAVGARLGDQRQIGRQGAAVGRAPPGRSGRAPGRCRSAGPAARTSRPGRPDRR